MSVCHQIPSDKEIPVKHDLARETEIEKALYEMCRRGNKMD